MVNSHLSRTLMNQKQISSPTLQFRPLSPLHFFKSSPRRQNCRLRFHRCQIEQSRSKTLGRERASKHGVRHVGAGWKFFYDSGPFVFRRTAVATSRARRCSLRGATILPKHGLERRANAAVVLTKSGFDSHGSCLGSKARARNRNDCHGRSEFSCWLVGARQRVH